MNKIEEIITRTAKISYNKNERILYVELFAGNELHLADSIDNYEATLKLTNNEAHCCFTKALGNMDISSDARKHASSAEIQIGLIANAVLVNSMATRIAGNFYIRFNKPSSPTRIFTNAEDAMSWLVYKKNEYFQKVAEANK